MGYGDFDLNSSSYLTSQPSGTGFRNNESKPQELIFDNNNNNKSLGFSNKTLSDAIASYGINSLESELQNIKNIYKPLGFLSNERYYQMYEMETLPSYNYIEKGYNLTLTEAQKEELSFVSNTFKENYDKYKEVADKTGLPPELICAIHYREGHCNFGTYLHNGQKLGKETTIIPKGLLFYDWTEAAVHAIKSQNYYKNVNNYLSTQLEFAERYNGVGYRRRGYVSPYVWGGTDVYRSGMFVADRKFDPNYKDTRIGVAAILTSLYGEAQA